MLEHTKARRIGPLDSIATSIDVAVTEAVSIRSVFADARLSLRVGEADVKAVGGAAGFNLDIPINSQASASARCAARLGPNEWLLIDGERSAEAVVPEIEGVLSGCFYSLVDIGHRNAGLEISGRHAADVLNSGCPLDLSNVAFPVGAATRTLFGKAEIILIRLAGRPHYRIECWRSFAQYVHEFLREAAREFEPLGKSRNLGGRDDKRL